MKTGIAVSLVAVMLLAPLAYAGVERRYSLGSHGYFVLEAPQQWSDRVGKLYLNSPPEITFSSNRDSSFVLKVSPSWVSSADPNVTAPEYVRAVVENRAHTAQNQSAAPTLPLIELQGPEARGYLYRFLDKDRRPHALNCWTLGIIIVGNLLVSVELHARSYDSAAQAAALELLRSARQKTKDGR